jgi:hypothetical protein
MGMVWGVLVALLGMGSSGNEEEIAAILERLEARGQGIRDLACDVELTTVDELAADEFTKFGEIRYQQGQPNPKFMVHFTKKHQNGRVDRGQEWYVFDGSVFWEVKERTKNRIRHEVIAQGQKVDFFDIEESPFPMPFGQKKDQILANFDVTLVTGNDGESSDVDHLLCVPKPQSRLAREHSKLEFFISRKLNLPVKIISVDPRGNQTTTVKFTDLSEKSLNRGLKDSEFELPAEAKKWKLIEAEAGEPLPMP